MPKAKAPTVLDRMRGYIVSSCETKAKSANSPAVKAWAREQLVLLKKPANAVASLSKLLASWTQESLKQISYDIAKAAESLDRAVAKSGVASGSAAGSAAGGSMEVNAALVASLALTAAQAKGKNVLAALKICRNFAKTATPEGVRRVLAKLGAPAAPKAATKTLFKSLGNLMLEILTEKGSGRDASIAKLTNAIEEEASDDASESEGVDASAPSAAQSALPGTLLSVPPSYAATGVRAAMDTSAPEIEFLSSAPSPIEQVFNHTLASNPHIGADIRRVLNLSILTTNSGIFNASKGYIESASSIGEATLAVGRFLEQIAASSASLRGGLAPSYASRDRVAPSAYGYGERAARFGSGLFQIGHSATQRLQLQPLPRNCFRQFQTLAGSRTRFGPGQRRHRFQPRHAGRDGVELQGEMRIQIALCARPLFQRRHS